MKTLLIILAGLQINMALFAQTDSAKNERKSDTITFNVGNKEIKIIDHEKKDSKAKHGWKRDCNKFKGHWQGVDLGLNNYLDKSNSMSLSGENKFMSLNTKRSMNVNLNFFQQSFGIIGNNFGVITGLGFEFYNYFFDNNNSIEKDINGYIVNKPYDNIHLDKSKLTVSYLSIPLLLELQIPNSANKAKRLRISAGVIGGLMLGSHTKIVYYENGDKKKEKNHDNLNLNSLRYGFTGRIGFRDINIYSNFYPVSLFEKNKGPELYPFAVGVSFVML